MPGKPEQLTELTKQLAESEGQRITLVETMYDPRCLNLVFARSNMNVNNRMSGMRRNPSLRASAMRMTLSSEW